MLSLLLAIGAVILVGAVCIWSFNNWIKALIYILLMLSVIFLGFSNLGAPRPYWLLGIPNGYLVSHYTNYNRTEIYLWIRPPTDSPPISFELPYSEPVQKMLTTAQKKAGPKGSIRIQGKGSFMQRLAQALKGPMAGLIGRLGNHRGGTARSGSLGSGNPFDGVPFEAYPQPWTGGPPKSLPQTWSGD